MISFRIYDTCISLFSSILHQKNSVFFCCDNTTSPNIGGTDAWAVPPPQILGEPSPQSPQVSAHDVMLCYALLCYAMLRYVMLCYTAICKAPLTGDYSEALST